MNTLHTFGYNQSLADTFATIGLMDCIPGRVVADYGGFLKVVTPDECEAEIAGLLLHDSEPYQLPKVGDWVAVQLGAHGKAMIRAVLPRLSEISRKAAGTSNTRQVLATNVDIAFVVQALDFDFSPMRLERYSYQLRQSNIEPIFIFNKADKAYDIDEKLEQIDATTMPYIVTSATMNRGIDAIRTLMADGKTAVFLGSSGVGKSTLTNALLGTDTQKTAAIRESDSTGRHTTSHRELFVLPGGGMIIDTPGIRELQLWGEEEFLAKSFGDIEALALGCEFRNCSHVKELQCAVLAAVTAGTLSAIRLESYLKFKNELQVNAHAAASLSAKQKKQRARRMKKAVQLDEKLQDDSELYD
jgi:ribosome biogenesis GTPase / thiamine phosphate phosphatase